VQRFTQIFSWGQRLITIRAGEREGGKAERKQDLSALSALSVFSLLTRRRYDDHCNETKQPVRWPSH
jgi:hypothetical protein